MNVLFVLVPLAFLLAGAGVAAFRWAVRDGQFDDVETPAVRMLFDHEEDDRQDAAAAAAPNPLPLAPTPADRHV